jgi:electron transport complex protein RnfD
VSVLFAELAEWCFRKATKQEIRNSDLSAAVTGLLLALVCPPDNPYWQTALGAIFAIIVAKEFFGGLGANVFNPALIGRAFLLMSFPAKMTSWVAPLGGKLDAVSGATLLNYVKQGIGSAGVTGPARWITGLDKYATAFGGGDYGTVVQNFFLGTRAGCIGESSIALILVGAIILIATRTIDLRAPVSMLVSAFVFSFFFYGFNPQFAFMSLLSGGLCFGAFFMATDYVTAPLTSKGKIIFGAGAGLITILIRRFGNYPEGVMFSILIMNMATPYLNRLLQKKYGFIRPVKGKGGAK